MDVLESLRGIPNVYLRVVNGKSRCGLDAILKGYGIEHWFLAKQVPTIIDPRRSMIKNAMDDLGVSLD